MEEDINLNSLVCGMVQNGAMSLSDGIKLMSQPQCGPAQIVDLHLDAQFTEYDAGAFGKIKVQPFPVMDKPSSSPDYQLTEEEEKRFDAIEGCTPEEIAIAKQVLSKTLSGRIDLGKDFSYIEFEVPMTKMSFEMDGDYFKPGDILNDMNGSHFEVIDNQGHTCTIRTL